MGLGARTWTAAYAGVAVLFLLTVATYYHPEFGFTAFIEFPATSHDSELPAVRAAPHYDHPDSGGYDGQFYAQIAVDPFLRDRRLDGALDNPPYRARRILMSWMSYAAGLGHPAAILQAYALHAVFAWLALAWLLARWIRPVDARGFVLASTAMLAHGPLMSVRYALPDLAAAVLIVLAVLAIERGRPWLSSLVVGAAGLARDSALVAASILLGEIRRPPRSWLRTAGCVALAAVPLVVWFDYIRSIYRSTALRGSDHFVAPFTGLWWKSSSIASDIASTGLSAPVIDSLTALAAFLAQGSWLVWRVSRHRDRSPWVLAGSSFLALAIFTDPAVWEGSPGAYPRVFMPVMLAAHVTLAQAGPGRWWLVALVALDIVPGIRLLVP